MRNLKALAYFAIIAFLLGAIILVDAKYIEPDRVVITKNIYNLTGTSSNPIKIVFISDIHIGSEKEEDFEKKIQLINDQNPDIILLGGDYINFGRNEIQKLRSLSNLRAKNGKYAILGNHDYGLWRSISKGSIANIELATNVSDELNRDGIRILQNQFEIININGKSIELYGLDDGWSGRGKYIETNPDLPKIILSHELDTVDLKKIENKAIILSGHTHCTEVRIPMFSEYLINNVLSGFGDVVGGWSKRSERVDAYVTCGITRGTSGFRFLTNPEVSIIEIY